MVEVEDVVETLVIVSKELGKAVPQLPLIASLLTCSICYESFTGPVVTQCSHTFCSLCIRKFLQFQQKCPSCLVEAHEPQLRPDRAVESLLQIWPALVTSLEDLLHSGSSRKLDTGQGGKENTDPNTSSSSSIIQTKNTFKESGQCDKDGQVNDNLMSASQGSRKVDLNRSQTSQCSVCGVAVSISHLEVHQTRCQLIQQGKVKTSEMVKARRPPLPKLVYAVMKESQLRKKCKEVGLCVKGDKQALVRRHKKFTLLYNVECQQENPRSNMHLALQVAREEKEEESGKIPTPTLLQYDRNTDTKIMEDKQKQYMKQHKDTFADLIAKAKLGKKTAPSEKQIDKVTVVEQLAAISSDVDIMEGGNSNKRSPPASSSLSDEDSVAAGGSKNPRKRSKSGDEDTQVKRTPQKNPNNLGRDLGVIYVTPTKSSIKELAKSPKLKTVNIIDQLNMSREQNRKISKVTCPSCEAQVTERFLNIHLDKCLRTLDPGPSNDPSPIFTKTRKRKVTKVMNPFLIDKESENDLGNTINVSDYLENVLEEIEIDSESDEVVTKNEPPVKIVIQPAGDEERPEPEERIESSPSLLDNMSDIPSSPLKFSDSLSQHSWGPGEKSKQYKKGPDDEKEGEEGEEAGKRKEEEMGEKNKSVVEEEEDMFAPSDNEPVKDNTNVEEITDKGLKEIPRHESHLSSIPSSAETSQTKRFYARVPVRSRDSSANSRKSDPGSSEDGSVRVTRRTARLRSLC